KNLGLLTPTLSGPAAPAGARKQLRKTSQDKRARVKRVPKRVCVRFPPKKQDARHRILAPPLETPRLENPQHLSSVPRLSGCSPDPWLCVPASRLVCHFGEEPRYFLVRRSLRNLCAKKFQTFPFLLSH